MEASPALEAVPTVTIEDQLEYYKAKAKVMANEKTEWENRAKHLAHKQNILRKNYRGMQRALEVANARASLAESSRKETFNTWRRADDAAVRLAQAFAAHTDEEWTDVYNAAYDPKLAR